MLLSFSVPEMRPMIEAGVRAHNGFDVGSARVKRQTIRKRGPRAEALLAVAREKHWRCPHPLHLWWKSRTKERKRLGIVSGGLVCPVRIVRSAANRGDFDISLTAEQRGICFFAFDDNPDAEAFARVDGFDSAEAFRDFFVPRAGDVFQGVIFTW